MKIKDAICKAKRLIKSESTLLDAEILLAFVLNRKRSYLYAYFEQNLSEKYVNHFFELVLARSKGHPIAHLIKKKEFWSLDFIVTKDTLIPRPETEILVETALELIPKNKPYSLLELGTGCGAIAISIAKERKTTHITAVDINKETLKIAKKNATLHDTKNILFKQGNWFNFSGVSSYDLIISNPPYISENDPHLKQGDVCFESKLALVSGKDGLDDIRKIIFDTKNHLKPSGWILLEHAYDQKIAVDKLFTENSFKSITTIKDYSRNDRVTIAQLSI